MENVVFNICEKFHNDRLRNDKSLGNRKSDNNKNYVRRAWRPVSGSKNHCEYSSTEMVMADSNLESVVLSIYQ